MNVVTALIDMYAKLGDIDSGRRIFVEASEKDVILWNCMIDKYAKSGLIEESIDLLRLMKLEQVKVNSSTLVGLLAACAASGSLTLGQCIADYVEDEVLALDANLGTAWLICTLNVGIWIRQLTFFKGWRAKM
ncbi:hypothetical protein LWI29_021764 [Acer saccharum]|uniref:Pentatricopeptide repeat-containing protein n=1 Tax=Acer saccharum TaxID=4024 RepID=A0AA39SZD0_ACESA|nr:hypothetical protein LWI29_021764 [Acer saccharum]